MKKSLIALAALGTIASAAQAQTAVTIYGTVDTGITYSNHNATTNGDGGSKFGVGSGNIDTSRLGFKGVEDLGGGLKALFQLEAGFNNDTGATEQGTTLLNRKSVVGLGGNFGTVLLGRQSDILDDAGHQYTSIKDFGNFVGSPHALDRLEGIRTQNSIRYDSPNVQGFKGSLIYGFGEQAGQNSAGQSFGAGGTYDNGPLGLYLGYYQSKFGSNPSDTLISSIAAASGLTPADLSGANLDGTTVNKTFSLGASYQAGPARLYGNWSRVNVPDALKQNVFELGADYAVTAPLHLLAAVQHTNTSINGYDGSKPSVTQVNLGLDYYLSKRTDLYTLASYAKGNNGALVGNIYSPAVQNDDGKSNQTAVAIGIRHKF
ncbi:gram-negative porin family protein [Collimonas arenae]|uniref:Gram-negative porin family protein n=1 Tax=Collimonas arenae TaxID=279058 RepID=A0A127PVQ7_9BURK|nr:porin [Collimonas arenae]AMP01901.1 gram-negative porin family protein [Collimonas arenae]AMP11800.1 gram-negative porin family protein [Collimonas arenae]